MPLSRTLSDREIMLLIAIGLSGDAYGIGSPTARDEAELLVKHELVKSVRRMPTSNIYAITPKGRRHINRLLRVEIENLMEVK